MKNNGILSQLIHNTSFHLMEQLIKTFYGFQVQLMSPEGCFLNSLKESEPDQSGYAYSQSDKSSTNKFNNPDILQAVRTSGTARIFESPESGCKQLLVPVIRKKTVIGFVYLSEKQDVRLSQAELTITLNFLTDYVRLLVKTDLEFADIFVNQDLTHQQCVIHDVMNYLQDNYAATDLTLKDVASWRGISYHYLSSLFKKEVRMTFKSYLQQIRLDKAARLLKCRNLSVSQIAYRCGFDDPGYFSKTFKRLIGLSPVDYRNRCPRGGKNPRVLTSKTNSSEK